MIKQLIARAFATAAIACAIPHAGAQIQVAPTTAPFLPIVATIAVPDSAIGDTQILWEADAATQFETIDSGRKLHVWATPGAHWLKASVFRVDWALKTFRVEQYRAEFAVEGRTPPQPTPPEIVPPPHAKLTAVILRETEQDTPAFMRMLVALRTGENAEWLASNGHALYALDDDALNATGEPLLLVQKIKNLGVALPALFILAGDTVLLKESLPANADAASVMAKIKACAK